MFVFDRDGKRVQVNVTDAKELIAHAHYSTRFPKGTEDEESADVKAAEAAESTAAEEEVIRQDERDKAAVKATQTALAARAAEDHTAEHHGRVRPRAKKDAK